LERLRKYKKEVKEMNIVEKIIEIIQSRKYLTIAEKNELEMDIKFNREVESKLQEKEVGIEEKEKEIEKLERELEEFEPFRGIKDAVEDFVSRYINR
jgi:hypothetical protein